MVINSESNATMTVPLETIRFGAHPFGRRDFGKLALTRIVERAPWPPSSLPRLR